MFTPIEEIPIIVDGLKKTFLTHKTIPLEWRRQQLTQLKRMVEDNLDNFSDALHADLKRDRFLRVSEVTLQIRTIQNAIDCVEQWMQEEVVSSPPHLQPGKSFILPQPLGVVLIIGPWNYPVDLIIQVMVGAIAAGNCMVVKPSEISENVTRLIADLIPQYMDNECIAVVEGAVAETTELLKLHFDKIFYTGNGVVGKIVLRAAAEHLTPVVLELGGKSPVIVAKDADLKLLAKRVLFGKFTNAGQTCIAPDYLLIEQGVDLEKLKQVFIDRIHEFYGPDIQQSPDYARIINSRHFDRLSDILETETPFFGGDTDRNDLYISPTFILNPSLDSRVMNEELFGPILPMVVVESIDAAIDFINERPRPLALYVFTKNTNKAQKVLTNTVSGGAMVNDCFLHITNPCLPFGGVGESGMGAYHGKASFDTFTHFKSVVDASTKWDPFLRYPPFTDFRLKLLHITTQPISVPPLIKISIALPIFYMIGKKIGIFGGPKL